MGACCSAPDGGVMLSPNPSGKRNASTYGNKSVNGSGKSTAIRKLPDFGILDLYEPIMLLGEGGSGATYLCEDKATAKRWAGRGVVEKTAVCAFGMQRRMPRGGAPPPTAKP